MFNLVTSKYNKLKSQNITLWMNHLLVVYSFLIPISGRGKTTVLFIILLLFLVRGNFKYYLEKAISNKVVQAMLLFFIVHIIWLIGSENTEHAKSVIDDMKYLLFPLLFLSFLDKKFFLRILTAFVIGMLYSEIVSYLIHFDILPYKLILYNIEIYEAAASNDPSPFLDHSRYAVLLSFTIALLLYNLLNKNNTTLVKSISVVFLITATINLSLIGGRIGYISFIAIVIFLIILRYRHKPFKVLVGLLLTFFLLFNFVYSFSELFKSRIDQSVNTINLMVDDNSNFNSSFGLRLGFWTYSSEVIKDNLLFGVGTGDHINETRAVIPNNHSYIKNISHPHNEYIKTFLQFGLIGLIILFNIFYQIMKYNSENKYKKDIKLIISLIILIAIMTSIFGSKIYLPLFVTIISAATTREDFLKSSFKTIDKKISLVYIGLSASALIISVLQ